MKSKYYIKSMYSNIIQSQILALQYPRHMLNNNYNSSIPVCGKSIYMSLLWITEQIIILWKLSGLYDIKLVIKLLKNTFGMWKLMKKKCKIYTPPLKKPNRITENDLAYRLGKYNVKIARKQILFGRREI